MKRLHPRGEMTAEVAERSSRSTAASMDGKLESGRRVPFRLAELDSLKSQLPRLEGVGNRSRTRSLAAALGRGALAIWNASRPLNALKKSIRANFSNLSGMTSIDIWARRADSMPELMEQLGILRFGQRPRVGDTFCGGGSIPFEAARLGCDVYASDLNPVACMLTWGALNIIGASPEDAA